MRIRERDLIILTVLTLVALVSRSYGLSTWDLYGDELFTFVHAHDRYTSLSNPAYYALAVASFKLFDMNEWAVRLPSMILGTLSVPVFFITWRNVVGRNAALIGAVLIILSSWHLHLSQFGRFYTGVFLFGSLAYYSYYQALRRDSRAYLMWALLANLVGFLFHATSVMVAVSCALFSAVVLLSKQSAAGYSRRVATLHLMLCAAAGLIATPFLLDLVTTWHGYRQTWGYGPVKQALQIVKFVQIPLAISALFGALLLLQKDAHKGSFFLLGIGAPILAIIVASSVLSVRPDYIFYSMPLVFVLAGTLCEQTRLALANYRFAAHALTCIVIAGLLPGMVSHYSGRETLDIREAVAFVEKSYQPEDQIVSFVKEFNHYMGIDYPIEYNANSTNYNEAAWAQTLAPYEESRGRVWIILDATRKPMAKDLDAWLLENASLVWRKYQTRFDYTVWGYEIFLVQGGDSRSVYTVATPETDSHAEP